MIIDKIIIVENFIIGIIFFSIFFIININMLILIKVRLIVLELSINGIISVVIIYIIFVIGVNIFIIEFLFLYKLMFFI